MSALPRLQKSHLEKGFVKIRVLPRTEFCGHLKRLIYEFSIGSGRTRDLHLLNTNINNSKICNT